MLQNKRDKQKIFFDFEHVQIYNPKIKSKIKQNFGINRIFVPFSLFFEYSYHNVRVSCYRDKYNNIVIFYLIHITFLRFTLLMHYFR